MDNPFSAFQTRDLSAAVDLIPNRYGYLGDTNVFPVRGITKTVAEIEIRDGVLSLLPITPRGGPATVSGAIKRRIKAFAVPQIAHEGFVYPDDVDGLRAFGTVTRAALMQLLLDKMTIMRNKHDQTLEYMRMSALKGKVADHDGSVIYDLFAEFGVTPKTINFQLNVAGTNVLAKVLDLKRHIEDSLLGDRMSGVEVLASEQFFDALVSHAKVKEAYANWQAADQRLGGDMRTGFTFGGVTFRELRGVIGGRKLIEDGDAHAYPLGTNSTFATFAAPADFNEAVGKPGQLFYAKVIPARFDRGYEIHTQANPLPLTLRPGVLVTLKAE